MATLSIAQAAQYAAAAGFSGQSLRTIVAIAQAESSLVTNARHDNGPAGGEGIDRGILQINSFWHAEYSDAQCDDPASAFAAGFTISHQGTDFAPWTTFRTGAYQQTPAWQQGATTTVTPPASHAWGLSDSERVWPWLVPAISNVLLKGSDNTVYRWNPPGENGTDFGLPLHTQITSLTLGKVVTAGYFGGGGVVSIQSTLPAPINAAIVYYQHLDTISVAVGQTVHVGDEIGLSGGQLTGGVHPVTCCSTGPHIEFGINPPSDGTGLWRNLGPNVDPMPFLLNIVQHGPAARDLVGGINPGNAPPGAITTNLAGKVITTFDASVTGNGPVGDSFLSIEQNINSAMQLVPFRSAAGTLVPNPVANWPVIGGVVNIFTTPVNEAASIQDWLSGASDWIGNNTLPLMIRSVFVLVGFMIIIAFIFSLFGSVVKNVAESDTGQAAVKVASVAAAA